MKLIDNKTKYDFGWKRFIKLNKEKNNENNSSKLRLFWMVYSEGVMKQEQKIKEFVDKWVGKHGFAGIFHNYRKDCIQNLINLLDNWIRVADELPKEGDEVLCFIPSIKGCVSAWMYVDDNDEGIEWIALDDKVKYYYEQVSHWQPLLKPPKE